MVWCGALRCVVLCCVVLWRGVVSCRVMWCGVVWCVALRCDVICKKALCFVEWSNNAEKASCIHLPQSFMV